MHFSLKCKQYGPRSDCSLKSSLIKVNTVCLQDERALECILLMQTKNLAEDIFREKNIGRLSVRLAPVLKTIFHQCLDAFFFRAAG